VTGFTFLPERHNGVVADDQPEMIATDRRVMHGQAAIAATRVPVSVILYCLTAGMATEEISAEYPSVTVSGVRAAAAYGAALAREDQLRRPCNRRAWSGRGEAVAIAHRLPCSTRRDSARQLPGC
jgi:uncharacterized protein (DUF433 family)